MKKITSLFLCILMLLPVLCSCHGPKSNVSVFEVPDSFDTSVKYEISFWAKNDTNINQVNIYNKAKEDFQKLYPNITVNIKFYTDYGKIYQDVITNIETNTTPNVCITYPDHIATYLTGNNIVVPLDELFDNEKYGLGGSELLFDSPERAQIVPKFLSECNIGGSHYALPYMRSTEALYVNKTYVEKLGYTLPDTVTWDFVFEVCNAAMKKNDDGTFAVNGQTVLLPFIYKSTDNMMIQMLRQKNAPYSSSTGVIELFSDETREIVNYIADVTKKGYFETFKRSGYPADYLNAGQCIFAVDSTAGATWMGSKAPLNTISEEKTADFETAVLPIPQYDTGNPKMISQGPSLCIFNKEDSGEVMASWLFMQFLLTNEIQIAYSQTEGYVPVTKKAQTSAEYLDYLAREGEDNKLYYDVKIKASKLLLENVNQSFVTPVFNGSASLRSAAGHLIEETVTATKRKQKLDTEKLFDDTESLYRLTEVGAAGGAKMKFGALPTASKLLLVSLGVIWIFIIAYFIYEAVKKRKNTDIK